MTTVSYCADCGKEEVEGIASLKACKSCKLVKYCNVNCQKNHWPTHKKACKKRAAELRDEALFKDPPPKEDCPICFLPMPLMLISCISLPPATILSVPIYDLSEANEKLANVCSEIYFTCCGKNICGGCIHSFGMSGNDKKCLFCKADFLDRTTDEEKFKDMMKRVEVNDAGAMCALALYYYRGQLGLLPDQEKAIELYTRAVELGSSQAHFALGSIYDEGGDLKKAKFYYEAAAMAGHDDARYNLGNMEMKSNKKDRALKHWMIAASAGNHKAMRALNTCLEIGHVGYVSRASIDSSLRAYNTSCTEMRSEARDAYIQFEMRRIERNNA